MSKAFTSESDDGLDPVEQAPLPAGFKNYMTPATAAKMAAEVQALLVERARMGDELTAKARREIIDRRLRYLQPRLDQAEVIDPEKQPLDHILFGAEVTLRDAHGNPQRWRIVGLDEVDFDKGWISWASPLAGAMLDKKVGERVVFREDRWTVEAIRYDWGGVA